MMRLLTQARCATTLALQAITVLSLLTLLIVVLWGTLSRYLLGAQSPWTEELARLLLVWVTMLGGALAFGERAHLAIDLVVLKLHRDARRLAELFSHVACGGFAVLVMVLGGGRLTLARFDADQALPALGISRAWVYASVPIAGLLIAWYAAEMILETLTGKAPAASDPDPASAVDA